MGKIALKTPAQEEALVLEPITETIAAHLDANCSSAILEGIRERAQGELDAKHAEEASLRERSVDPRLTVAQAREKRDQAEDAAHEARRIAVAIQALDETLPARKAAEHKAAIMPAYLAAKEQREKDIERLRDRWPKLAAEMLALIQMVERYRHEPGVEIPDGEDPLRGDIELEARGLAGFYADGQPVATLASARIPNFVHDAWKQYLWTEQMKGIRSW